MYYSLLLFFVFLELCLGLQRSGKSGELKLVRKITEKLGNFTKVLTILETDKNANEIITNYY